MKNGENLHFRNNPNFDLHKRYDDTPELAVSGLSYVLAASDKIRQEIVDAKEAYEKVKKESMIDELTGCFNRNYLEKYKSEIFDPKRDDQAVGLVLADLNGLKEINDKLGHTVGDDKIIEFASILKNSFRKKDEVIRMGGDEFLVICRNEKGDDDFVQNLYDRAQESRKLNPDSSFAFGVAVYDRVQDGGIGNTITRADALMYADKKEIKEANQREVYS